MYLTDVVICLAISGHPKPKGRPHRQKSLLNKIRNLKMDSPRRGDPADRNHISKSKNPENGFPQRGDPHRIQKRENMRAPCWFWAGWTIPDWVWASCGLVRPIMYFQKVHPHFQSWAIVPDWYQPGNLIFRARGRFCGLVPA